MSLVSGSNFCKTVSDYVGIELIKDLCNVDWQRLNQAADQKVRSIPGCLHIVFTGVMVGAAIATGSSAIQCIKARNWKWALFESGCFLASSWVAATQMMEIYKDIEKVYNDIPPNYNHSLSVHKPLSL